MAKGHCERIGIEGSNLQHTNVAKDEKTKIEKPILSQRPFAITCSLSISISWYFNDELPAFITNIFILKFLSFFINL